MDAELRTAHVLMGCPFCAGSKDVGSAHWYCHGRGQFFPEAHGSRRTSCFGTCDAAKRGVNCHEETRVEHG